MDGGPPGDMPMRLSPEALARVMPMHVAVDEGGDILSIGPTLAALLPEGQGVGSAFFALFRLRRPAGVGSPAGLMAHAGQRLELSVKEGGPAGLRGLAVPMAGGGMLLNLSFGIGLIEAVRQHGLTDADFAPTDLAVEMLYLVEAKNAVLDELRSLNLRLQGAKAEAEEQALTDTLTGLRNRRALELVLDALVWQGVPFSLMHLDLDFFKQVNDTLGHAAGDHVLRAVAQALTDETRAEDTVARIGGDEFVILLPRLCDGDSVLQIAHRIIERLSVPIPYQDTHCRISASVGAVLSIDYPMLEAGVLLADADAALYASKHAGRGVARLQRR